MSWQLVIAGLAVGTLVGMTGMGGGSLMTPILVVLLGFSPTVAIGTDIAHGALFKTVGAIRHRRLGNVQARLSGWMLLGSAPSSIGGVILATWLKHRYGGGINSISSTLLGGALLFGCVGLALKTLVRRTELTDAPFILSCRDRVAAVLIGIVGGFVVGLTSVGTGVFFGLTMLVVFPLRARKVVGTDIFHAAALLYVAGFAHLLAGNVNLGAVAWLLAGSIPGVLLGSQFSLAVSDRFLRGVLAVVLGLSGLRLLHVPLSTPIVAVLGSGAVMFAAWIVFGSPRRRVATTSARFPATGGGRIDARDGSTSSAFEDQAVMLLLPESALHLRRPAGALSAARLRNRRVRIRLMRG